MQHDNLTDSTDSPQNAMNAAEITDKLGLHSLRQRAWVSEVLRSNLTIHVLTVVSIFNLLALRLVMVCMRVLSGSAILFERRVTIKLGNEYHHPDPHPVSQGALRIIVTLLTPHSPTKFTVVLLNNPPTDF